MGKVSSTNSSPNISNKTSTEETPSTGDLSLTPVKRLHDGSVKSTTNFRATLSQNSQDLPSPERSKSVVPSQPCCTNISKKQFLSNNLEISSKNKIPHDSPTQNLQTNKLLQFTSTNSPTEKFLLKHTPKKLKITKSLDSSSPYKCESIEPSQVLPVNSSAEKSFSRNPCEMSLNKYSPDNLNKKSLDSSSKNSSEPSTNITSDECSKIKNSSSIPTQKSQSTKMSLIPTVESSRKKTLSQSSWKSCAINRNYLEVFSRGPTILLEDLIHTDLLSTEQRKKLRLLAEKNKKKKRRNLSHTSSSRSDDIYDNSNSFHINDKTLRSLPARDERLKLEKDSQKLSWEKTSSLSEYNCSQQLKNFLSIDESEQNLDITRKLRTRNVTPVHRYRDEEKKWRKWNLESSSSSDEDKSSNHQLILQDSKSVDLISSDELVIDETPIKKKSKEETSLPVKKRRGRKPLLNKKLAVNTKKLPSNDKVVDTVEKLPELSVNLLDQPQVSELPVWKILNITRIIETHCGDVRICLKMNIRTESEAKRSGLFDQIVKNRKDRNPLNRLPKKKIVRKPYGKRSAEVKKNSESSVTKQKYATKNMPVKETKVEPDGNINLDGDDDDDDDDDNVNGADLVVKKMPSMPAIENVDTNQQNKIKESKVEIKMETDHQMNPDSSIDVDQNVIKHETASICDSSNDIGKTDLPIDNPKLTNKKKYPEIIHETILPAGSVSLVSSVLNERYLPKINYTTLDKKTSSNKLTNKRFKSKDLSAEMRDDRLKRAFENWAQIPELNNLISPSSSVVDNYTQTMDTEFLENLNDKFSIPEELAKTTQKVRKKIVYNVIDQAEKKSMVPLTLKNVKTFTNIARNSRQGHLPEISKPTTRIRTRISPPTSRTNQPSFKNEPSSTTSRGKKGRRDWKKESLDGESNSSTEISPEHNTLKRTSSDDSLPRFGKTVTIQNNDTPDEPFVRRVLDWVNENPKIDGKNSEELNLSDDSSYCSSKKSKSRKIVDNLPTADNKNNFNLPTDSHINEEVQGVIDKNEGIVSQTNELINSVSLVDKCDNNDNEDKDFIQALNNSFKEEEELLYGISPSPVNKQGEYIDRIEINVDKTVNCVDKVDSSIDNKTVDVDKVENMIVKDILAGNENNINVNNKAEDENNDDALSNSSSSSDSNSSLSSSSSSSSTQSQGSNEAQSSGFIEATQCSSKSNLQSTCKNNETVMNNNEISSQMLVINDDTVDCGSTISNTHDDNRLVIDEDIVNEYFNDDDIANTESNFVIDNDNIEVKLDSKKQDNIQQNEEFVATKSNDDSDDMDSPDSDRISLYAESTLLFDCDLKSEKFTCSSPKLSSFGENPNLVTPKKKFNHLQSKLNSPHGFYNRMESNIFDNYRELTAKDFDNDYTNITVQNGSITTQKFRNRQMQYNDRVSNSTMNNGPVVPSYARSPNHINNNDVKFNNFNMSNHTSNNINSFIRNHKLKLDSNLTHQKPKFVIDPLVDMNNPVNDYVKAFFNGNCFNYLKTGNCDRNNCRHPHEMKPRILHMHMELPLYIKKMLIYAFEHKFHYYLRFVYFKAIQRLDPPDILNFFSIIFYVQNRQWVVEYLGWTIDTLISKNRSLISIVNYLRDRMIEMGSMIKPPMTPGEMFYLIINQLTPRIDSGTYWETFQPLILSQLTLPALIVDIVLQECIDYNKPYAHIKDVHSTLILGLRDNIFGQGNPVLFTNFMALLENYEKMEVLNNTENIINEQFAIEIRQKPQETISLASPDGLSTNLIADNVEPTSSTIVNKYIPERDLIQPTITHVNEVIVTNSINMPKLPEKLLTSSPSNVLNNQKPRNGEILFDNKHKLIKVDVNNPKSVHEHYIWLFRADLENIQAAMKKNDYDEIIKILNINKRSQLQPFVRGFYRILCGEIMESSRHLTEIIQRTGNDYFNKSPTGEIKINYEH